MVENYPLHKFVYNDDILSLSRYLQQPQLRKQINQKDLHGNTPLQLALMLDRRNCAQKLIDNGADTSLKNEFGWSCLDEASMLGDIDLLEKLIYQKWYYEIGRCIKPGGNFDQWNKLLPNFHAQMAVSFRSPVPLLAKICPRDIITIRKKGSKIRIDFHIVGLDRRTIPKFLKGDMSVIINITPNEELPIVHLLDHTKKSFQELFPNIPSWSLYDFVSQYCNATSIVNFNLNLNDIKLKKRSKKIFGKAKTVKLNNNKTVKADLYKFTNVILTTKERLNERLIGDRPSTIITSKIIHKKRYSKESTPKGTTTTNGNEGKKEDIKKSKDDFSDDSDNFESDDDEEEEDDDDDDEDEYEDFNSTSSENNSKDYPNLMEVLSSNKGPLNRKTKEQITHMLITGKDENNQPLLKKDIEFLNSHIEQYLEDMDNDSVDAIYLDPPKHTGQTSSVVSFKSNSTNTLIETRSIESFNTSKFVSHSTIMSPASTKNHHHQTTKQATTTNSSNQLQPPQQQQLPHLSKLGNSSNTLGSINTTTTTTNTSSNFNNNEKVTNNNSLSSLVNSNPSIERIREVVSEVQNEHWANKEMLTSEYFGSKSPSGPLHMGRKLNIEYDQHIYKHKAKFYMCKCDSANFPVSLSQFAPFLEYFISYAVNDPKEKDQVKPCLDKIIKNLDGSTHFPGKIEIPIMATVFAKLKFKNIHTDESQMPDDLFVLPQNYQPNDVFFRIIN